MDSLKDQVEEELVENRQVDNSAVISQSAIDQSAIDSSLIRQAMVANSDLRYLVSIIDMKSRMNQGSPDIIIALDRIACPLETNPKKSIALIKEAFILLTSWSKNLSPTEQIEFQKALLTQVKSCVNYLEEK